jgi:transposase
MSHEYPSDISKEAFKVILPILESVRKSTKPRTVDLYDVFCAILYLLKSGCQWRMLPKEYPDRVMVATLRMIPERLTLEWLKS